MDSSYLDWPFFDDAHRDFAHRLEAWAAAHLGAAHGDDVDATRQFDVQGHTRAKNE